MIENELNLGNAEDLTFITFPIWKLVILDILTLGLYQMIWFYKYWKTIRDTKKEKISPFWRALFAGVSCFWLFPILEKYILKHHLTAFSGIGMAIIYLLLCATCNAPDPIWILCSLTIVPIIIIQLKINEINKNSYPNATQYHWSWKTTLGLIAYWIVFIMIVFLMAIVYAITTS